MKFKNRFPVAIAMSASVVALILYLIADYMNLPSRLGINVARINEGILGVVFSVVVSIIIFALTYYYVEQWNIKKHNNQAAAANALLKKTYEQCKQCLVWLDWPQVMDALIKRTDFDAVYYHNSPSDRFANLPFENENLIMQFIGDGILTRQQIDTYFGIKHDLSSYAFTAVAFYDRPEMAASLRKPLEKKVEEALSQLK